MEFITLFIVWILSGVIVHFLVKNNKKRDGINIIIFILLILIGSLFLDEEKDESPLEITEEEREERNNYEELMESIFGRNVKESLQDIIFSYKGYTLENISIDTVTHKWNSFRIGDSSYVEMKLTVVKGDSIKNIWFLKSVSDSDDDVTFSETDNYRKYWIRDDSSKNILSMEGPKK